jgi:hypothetical protein
MHKIFRKILNYKKPAFWAIIAVLVASVVLIVFLVTNPKNNEPAKKDDPAVTGDPAAADDPTAITVDATAPLLGYNLYSDGGQVDFVSKKIKLKEYPGEVFELSPEFTVTSSKGTRMIFTAAEKILIYDLTGDGKPDFCFELDVGSGIIDHRIIVYDHSTGEMYELSGRKEHKDYWLEEQNDTLVVREGNFRKKGLSKPYEKIVFSDGMLKCVSEDGKDTAEFAKVSYSVYVHEYGPYEWSGKDITSTLFDAVRGEYYYITETRDFDTTMSIGRGGNFRGVFNEFESGADGTGKIKNYSMSFTGAFKNVRRIGDCIYSFELSELNDDILIETSSYLFEEKKHGFIDCKEFNAYLPGCSKADIPQDVLNALVKIINVDPELVFYDDKLTVMFIYTVTTGNDHKEQVFVRNRAPSAEEDM